nr:MAG TPA: envelope protein [Caudoviricetes sp.]
MITILISLITILLTLCLIFRSNNNDQGGLR